MNNKSVVAVAIEPGVIEYQELPLPEITADSALLQVEAASVCGSDWQLFWQKRKGPFVLGHENVGRIVKIGHEASKRWGVKEGDRVALEEYIPCGVCSFCRSGSFRDCLATDSRRMDSLRYGTTPITESPGLWGGYGQYVYVHPNSVVHKIPTHIKAEVAALNLAVANGVQWTHLEGGAGIGDVVVIQGPGRQGLTCALAAKQAGASKVIITGLSSDKDRLEFALRIGADHIIDVEKEDVKDTVFQLTNGHMADIVIDVASGGSDTISQAIQLTRKRGTVVLAASKQRPLKDFVADDIISKHLSVKGVRGHSYTSVEMAIQTISSGRFPLEEMCTHNFRLDQVEEAILTVGRKMNLDCIQGTVLPWS